MPDTTEGGRGSRNPCAALCTGLALILGGIITLGWNERRTVCKNNALILAEQSFVSAQCDEPSSSYAGKLVYLSCPMKEENMRTYSAADVDSKHAGLNKAVGTVKGLCFEQRMQVMQCKEKKNRRCISRDEKKACTKYVTDYEYSKEFTSEFINSSEFFQDGDAEKARALKLQVCGSGDNPSPQSFPFPSLTASAPRPDRVKLSDTWSLTKEQIDRLTSRCDDVVRARKEEMKPFAQARVQPIRELKADNVWVDDNTKNTFHSCADGALSIGCLNVQFLTKAPKYVSLLYKVSEKSSFEFEPFRAPGSWLCGPTSVSHIVDRQFGSYVDLFTTMQSEEDTLMWGLRVLGFMIILIGIGLFLSPVEWLARNIPFIGDYVGGAVGWLLAIVALLLTIGFSLITVSIVWVAMRPMVGIPLLLAGLFSLGFSPCLLGGSKKQKGQ